MLDLCGRAIGREWVEKKVKHRKRKSNSEKNGAAMDTRQILLGLKCGAQS